MTDAISFRSAGHKQRFLTAIKDIDKVYEGGRIDQEYGAALYVLTSEQGTWDRAQGYVHRDEILFKGILDGVHWSEGYRVLIRWAANLFDEHTANCNPVELMRLDDNNYRVALSALAIRRHSLQVDDLK